MQPDRAATHSNSDNVSVVKSSPASTDNGQWCCDSCQGKQFTKLFDAPGFDDIKEKFTLVRCDQCALVSVHPLLSEQELGPYYSVQYYGSADQKFTGPVERWTRFTHERLAKRILSFLRRNPRGGDASRPPKVLDIGCGRASLLSALAQLGCDCTGLEREDFPEHKDKDNVKILYGDISHKELVADSFDAIVIWHVLEHLGSPHETVRMARRLLKPNGLLLIGVPNFGGFQARLFKQHWWHLDLPRHLYHFTAQSLGTLLSKEGFQIRKKDTFTIDQSFFGFLQSALNRMFPAQANSLYGNLKPDGSGGGLLLPQLLLAGGLLPVAAVEYVLSGVVGQGSCLIYYATAVERDNK
ncbi:MAG: class I SAM-dependent methyltransferase [Gammaproteobacteria bacterium]|nr:class I SAM-dependent methyltransferase [Gammaproteobacteria bacterium]MDH5800016.1 class I SAM-dependent methyltransferase [Gammaproteobacteria bacterium]